MTTQESPVLGCAWNCVKPSTGWGAEPEVQQGSLHLEPLCAFEHTSAVIPPQDPVLVVPVMFQPCLSQSPWILASDCRLPRCDLEPFCLHHKILLFLFLFFYLQLYLRHVSCLWLLIKFSVFWFCDLTFLLLAALADTALSATFSGGGFSSEVTDEILESGAKNCSLWVPSENMWHNKLICVSHLEISDFLVTLNEACWLHLTSALFVQHQLNWLARSTKLATLFQR